MIGIDGVDFLNDHLGHDFEVPLDGWPEAKHSAKHGNTAEEKRVRWLRAEKYRASLESGSEIEYEERKTEETPEYRDSSTEEPIP